MPNRKKQVIHIDPYEAATLAGLHYASPEGAGVQRVRSGRGFKYIDSSGQAVQDKAFIRRARSLVIPPAWARVWVSSDPNGHIQAVGWDAKGRKQYRYHALYREVRDHAKFDRLAEFGRVLPKIRAAVRADLSLKGLPQRKVVAVVVRLLEETCIRIGNEEYERLNGSFGLTTMKSRHVTIDGSELRFRFKGKSGQTHDILMKDTRLARIVRACQCIPGYELFQYKDETGEVHTVKSEDVNAYLSEITSGNFTAKDFRTWAGTCTAADYLRQREPAGSKAELKRVVAKVVKQTAEKLGNRAATCRKYYIHPIVFTAFENGTLAKAFEKFETAAEGSEDGLKPEEQAVLYILETTPGLLAQVVKMRVRHTRRRGERMTKKELTVTVTAKTAELAS